MGLDNRKLEPHVKFLLVTSLLLQGAYLYRLGVEYSNEAQENYWLRRVRAKEGKDERVKRD